MPRAATFPLHLFALLAAWAAAGATAIRAAESRPAIDSWSGFGSAETASLQPGVIQLKANSSMTFARGLSAQAIYVVEGRAEAAVQVLKTLDPTRSPELEVYQQRTFRAEGEARFSELKIDPKAAPFQQLLSEMAAPKHLQLSKEEHASLPRSPSVAVAQEFWARVLGERWSRFAREGQLAAVGSFDVRSELRSLLHEEPKVAAHFTTLLQPWIGTGSIPAATASSHYWDVSNTEGLANYELGAIFERTEDERRQVLDVTYYSSGGYLAAMNLFEFIPIAGRTSPQTLVWHGTLLSSAEIAGALGVKRKFAVHILEGQMRQWIGIFRRACAEGKK